jgi:EmrB/QacA subfamily drug resistance transporter
MSAVNEMPQGIKSRWWAFAMLCLGTLMVTVDSTIVNVALPSIGADLSLSGTSLMWVVNAYALTFSGSLLLAARLGDFLGHRLMYLLGIAVFTSASLCCGLASNGMLLIGARTIQGLGGAIVSSVSLSLALGLFTGPFERAKAIGMFSFVGLFGGASGVLFGGVLTGTLNWHWVFLINLPIGILVYVFCFASLPKRPDCCISGRRLDVAGAVAVTAAAALMVYATVSAAERGWLDSWTGSLFVGSGAFLLVFLRAEASSSNPIVPLTLFRRRGFTVACVICVLWFFATSGWLLIAALYLEGVLKRSPEEIGVIFLPANLLAAAVSLGLSARLVAKFGVKPVLLGGLLVTSFSLALFARLPVAGDVIVDVLPGIFLAGVGSGLACSPMLLAATSGIEPTEAGLISGVVSTVGMIGGALGLATLVSTAAARTDSLVAAGVGAQIALNSGYHFAFALGSAVLVIAAVVTAMLPQNENVTCSAAVARPDL